MSAFIDRTGKVYGSLIVTDEFTIIGKYAKWKCLCTFCNKHVDVMSYNLHSGNSKRCNKCKGKLFNNKQADIIREQYKSGLTYKKIAEIYNVSITTIGNIIKFR